MLLLLLLPLSPEFDVVVKISPLFGSCIVFKPDRVVPVVAEVVDGIAAVPFAPTRLL